MQHVDLNSPELRAELEKTWKFVKKVNQRFGFVQTHKMMYMRGLHLDLLEIRYYMGRDTGPCYGLLEIPPEGEKNRLIIRILVL